MRERDEVIGRHKVRPDRLFDAFSEERIIAGDDLRMMKARRAGICPRCHVFIRPGSLIVELDEPEQPWTIDAKRCLRTGENWHWNGELISLQPRWWVHWRCYVDVLVTTEACVYCGVEAGEEMTVDHVIPKRYGGTDQPSNLVPACRSCNSAKHTLPAAVVGMKPAEIRLWLKARGWVQGDGSAWVSPDRSCSYTQSVACRVAAFGRRAQPAQTPAESPADNSAAPELRLW